jgi:hypothetical protein
MTVSKTFDRFGSTDLSQEETKDAVRKFFDHDN